MRRVSVLGLAGLVLLAACGGGRSSSSGTTASTPDAPKGPATAAVTVTGDAGLAGEMTRIAVSCDNPGFDGNTITVGGAPPGQGTDPAAAVYSLFISAGKVVVRVGSGSGTAFVTREFTGTGVTDFNAATGTTIDSPVTETTAADANKGTLGAVTAVEGTVNCGGFTAGTSTVKLTGTTAEGAVDGVLAPVLVSCTINDTGSFVIVRGLVAVGSTKGLFFVTTSPDGALSVFESVQSGGQHQYMAPSGSGSPTAETVTIKGDAVESGGTNTLHVEGNATCGSSG